MNIKEVSKKYNISAETLRYYERIALIPKIHRDKNGYRDYTEKDLNWIYYVKALRRAGVSIDSVAEYVILLQQGDETRKKRKEILLKQEKQLENSIKEMQEALYYLRSKIQKYDGYIKEFEEQLMKED